MKLIYDEFLGKYYDEDGNEVEGVPVVEGYRSYNKPFEATEMTGADVDMQDNQKKALVLHNSIVTFKKQIDALEKQKKEVLDRLLKEMQDRDLWQVKVGDATITRKRSFERKGIDTKRLKEEMPEVAEIYETNTIVAESILIKVGGADDEI